MKRRPISRKHSKKLFSHTAAKTKAKNYKTTPMRGGIRL